MERSEAVMVIDTHSSQAQLKCENKHCEYGTFDEDAQKRVLWITKEEMIGHVEEIGSNAETLITRSPWANFGRFPGCRHLIGCPRVSGVAHPAPFLVVIPASDID